MPDVDLIGTACTPFGKPPPPCLDALTRRADLGVLAGAGARQVPGARPGLNENGGGVIAFDDAVFAARFLEAAP